jgi:TusA-related sulfurtransferase
MEAKQSLDCVGLYYPMPIVQTAAKIKELAPGDILEVVADDKGIVNDMPAWCEATDNKFLGIEETDGEYRVYIRKKA